MFGKDWGMLFLEEGCWKILEEILIFEFWILCYFV